MKRRVLDILEAAYIAGRSEQDWRADLLESVRCLDDGAGVVALEMRRQGDRAEATQVFGSASPEFQRWFGAAVASMPMAHVKLAFSWGSSGKTASSIMRRDFPAYEAGLAQVGSRDILTTFGLVDEKTTFGLYVPLSKPRAESPARQRRMRLLGAHLGSARRARASTIDDAWLHPDGRLVDARGPAVSQRAALREAVRAIDRARAKSAKEDEAFSVWTALIDGTWSLLDQFDSDGRRFVVARRNPPELTCHLALSENEARVAKLISMGQSSKYVAYSLGLSEPSVCHHLEGALLKLGLKTRADLVKLFQQIGDPR